MGRITGTLVLITALSLPAADASAQLNDDDAIAATIFAALGASVGGVGGTVTGIAQPIYLARSRRPPTGWLVTGGIFGGISAVSGVALMAVGLGERAEEPALIGGISMALGLYNLMMVILGSRMPGLSTAAGPVAVTPALGGDGRGGKHIGVNLTLVPF